MSYDSVRQRVVMFGGYDDTSLLNDTWEYDGTNWTRVTTTTAPAARVGAALAYDPVRQVTVLFGGAFSTTGFPPGSADTWTWNGTTWTQLTPASAPNARYNAGLTWASDRQRLVLHGGENNGTGTNYGGFETWEWDGTTWVLRIGYPSILDWPGDELDYDERRQTLVLHVARSGLSAAETWELAPSASQWVRRATNPAITQSNDVCTMAYDGRSQTTVLTGPTYGTNLPLTWWVWDGTTWTSMANGPSPNRVGARMVYDAARRKLVLFGGYGYQVRYNDTWEY